MMQDADYPAVSPDGRWVAFSRTASGGRRRIFVDLLDGTGEAACLTGERDGLWDHVDPAWSPDGRQLAYADQRDLWVVAASGGPARPLTSAHDNDRQPVWSADEQWVYFASKRGATDAVWRIASHGGTPQRVTMGTGPETHPDVSRDGARLVYSTFSQQFDVTVIDLRAGTRFEIRSSVLDNMPTLSPDGSAVVFVSNRSGSYELWRQAIRNGGPDGPPVRLTDHGDNVALPAFSPDGAWVAYFRARGANRDIWMVPASGGSPVQVTEDPSQDLQPAFSPDGGSLAFVSGRSGREHVWIQPMAGSRRTGEPWQLTDGEDPDFLPVWSPDGTTMAFNRSGEIWLSHAARGSTPRRLTSDAGAQVLRWEPDGTSLLARGVWGGSELQLRRFRIADGMASAVDVGALLGGASEAGSFDLSRDGQILAIDHSEPGGDLWILEVKGARTR
jgi:TolB protein